jgi:hypothetical protein
MGEARGGEENKGGNERGEGIGRAEGKERERRMRKWTRAGKGRSMAELPWRGGRRGKRREGRETEMKYRGGEGEREREREQGRRERGGRGLLGMRYYYQSFYNKF